jgi:thiol-disulfide isomerase/thioredoxin/DNA-binding beta-propeller fold protein YncE
MHRYLFVIVLAVVAASCTPSAGESPGAPAVDSSSTSVAGADVTTTSEERSPFVGRSYAGTTDAPEFPEGLQWINVDTPLTMNALKGKVVLLDFWTYGCINCIHIIPDLERLEAEYPDELVVVGVHSAKFPNEGKTGNLENIVQRYGITHPVVNDKGFAVWNSWGAQAWPTVAIVDPASRVVGLRAGEGVYEAVKPVIASLVAEFDASQAINRDPIAIAPEADSAPDRPLSYPGKVLAAEGRLWISDTGHHRILEVDPGSGDVLAAYGSGRRGSDDGPALEASFNAPQGLALGDGTLYVADTNNHLIRSIDLASGDVTTIAGTGRQGWPPESGQARSVGLSNPWAIVWDEGRLYIANAGTHQLWLLDTARDTMGPLVGSSLEGTANGPFRDAELAQPSGLALTDARQLYFADSESSSIRVADLTTEETRLVVGGDANLFEFGDEDGRGNEARLQHPLGTAYADGTLYVADTYNSKIKRVDTATNTITSWLGADAGFANGSKPLFDEPGGLSLDGGILYVADTNNHSVRIVDIATGSTSTLILKGIEAFDPPAEYRGEIVSLDPVTLAGGAASVLLDYSLPAGYKVNADAPSSIVISSGTNLATFSTGDAVDLTGTTLPVSVPTSLTEGTGTMRFDVTIIYCRTEETSLCLIDRVRYELPATIGPPGASSQITLARSVEATG